MRSIIHEKFWFSLGFAAVVAWQPSFTLASQHRGLPSTPSFPSDCAPISLKIEAQKVDPKAACQQIASLLPSWNLCRYPLHATAENWNRLNSEWEERKKHLRTNADWDAWKKSRPEWDLFEAGAWSDEASWLLQSSEKVLEVTGIEMCSKQVKAGSNQHELYVKAWDKDQDAKKIAKLPYLYSLQIDDHWQSHFTMIPGAAPRANSTFPLLGTHPALREIHLSNLITPTVLDSQAVDDSSNGALPYYGRAYVLGWIPAITLANSVQQDHLYGKAQALYRGEQAEFQSACPALPLSTLANEKKSAYPWLRNQQTGLYEMSTLASRCPSNQGECFRICVKRVPGKITVKNVRVNSYEIHASVNGLFGYKRLPGTYVAKTKDRPEIIAEPHSASTLEYVSTEVGPGTIPYLNFIDYSDPQFRNDFFDFISGDRLSERLARLGNWHADHGEPFPALASLKALTKEQIQEERRKNRADEASKKISVILNSGD